MRKYSCAPCNEMVSSNCIIYSGPAIPALGIECEEPLNSVIAAIVAEIIETTPSSIDLSTADLKCLAAEVQNKDIKEIIEVLATSHCNLKQMVEDIQTTTQPEQLLITWGCMDTSGNNPSPMTTTAAINRVVAYVCNLQTALNTRISSLDTRMNSVETTVNNITVPQFPTFNASAIQGANPSTLEATVNLLITRLSATRTDVGSVPNIYPSNLISAFGGTSILNPILVQGVPSGVPSNWSNLSASITALCQVIANMNLRLKVAEERLQTAGSSGLVCGLLFNLFGDYTAYTGVEVETMTHNFGTNASTATYSFYVQGIQTASSLYCKIDNTNRTAVDGDVQNTGSLASLSDTNFHRLRAGTTTYRVDVKIPSGTNPRTLRIGISDSCFYEFTVGFSYTGNSSARRVTTTLTQTTPVLSGQNTTSFFNDFTNP